MHRFWIETENEKHDWGPPSDKETAMNRMTKETITFDDPLEVPIGFFGSWNFKGLTSFGVITMNDSCVPSNGEY